MHKEATQRIHPVPRAPWCDSCASARRPGQIVLLFSSPPEDRKNERQRGVLPRSENQFLSLISVTHFYIAWRQPDSARAQVTFIALRTAGHRHFA